VPTVAGDRPLFVVFKSKDGNLISRKEILLIINPDPRELWSKNIPTPTDIEYYKPDSDSCLVKDGARYMAAASQRGRSHAIAGNPRDDDFAMLYDSETDCYIMAVADGAGSATFSRQGSKIACDTVLTVCKEKLHENRETLINYQKQKDQKQETGAIFYRAIENAVLEAYKALEKEAQDKNRHIKNYHTTLILTICKKIDAGWLFGAWWVGDGGIGIYRSDPQDLKVLGEPDGGEYAGQTRFLTMAEVINKRNERIKFALVEDFTALVLMTDGVTDPKFETDANIARIEKWRELFDDLNGKNDDDVTVELSHENENVDKELLKWLDFWSKGNHDDRTIALLF
jgi:serine/threonine protein phosphatase PrpC